MNRWEIVWLALLACKEILGNCRQQSIAEIWTSPRYRELRARHRRAEQERLALCAACSHSFV